MWPRGEFGRMSRLMTLSGMFLVLLLHGCSTQIDVKCGLGKGKMAALRDTPDVEDGGMCYIKTPYIGTAVGFIDDSTRKVIPTGSSLTCSSGSKCLGGTCQGGSACKSHYTAGACYCGC